MNSNDDTSRCQGLPQTSLDVQPSTKLQPKRYIPSYVAPTWRDRLKGILASVKADSCVEYTVFPDQRNQLTMLEEIPELILLRRPAWKKGDDRTFLVIVDSNAMILTSPNPKSLAGRIGDVYDRYSWMPNGWSRKIPAGKSMVLNAHENPITEGAWMVQWVGATLVDFDEAAKENPRVQATTILKRCDQ
jgi:hypothetical protein